MTQPENGWPSWLTRAGLSWPRSPRTPGPSDGDSWRGRQTATEIKLWQIGAWDEELAKARTRERSCGAQDHQHLAFGVEEASLSWARTRRKSKDSAWSGIRSATAKPPMAAIPHPCRNPSGASRQLRDLQRGRQANGGRLRKQDDDQAYACVFDVANADYQLEPTKTPSDSIPGCCVHGGAVNQVRFSHDGRRVVTSARTAPRKCGRLRGASRRSPRNLRPTARSS